MSLFLGILFFFTGSNSCKKILSDTMTAIPVPQKQYHYLALGDSYTIGETVAPTENFPYHTVAILRNEGLQFHPARIIAKTGWTTDELETGIIAANMLDPLQNSYDLVSLLIGVNNQYRGQSVQEYNPEFEELLKKAIRFAGNRTDRVVVLSIPDWGVTPFANGRDRVQIAREIDAFNKMNKQVAQQYNVYYINITTWTREASTDPSLLASDGLHPSGIEYKRWAEKIAAYFKSKF